MTQTTAAQTLGTQCHCTATHEPKLVVVTGGPGAGKTAILEIVRRHFCPHVVVLPEAASIVFGGGFPRRSSTPARKSAQRAIFYVERELERMATAEGNPAVVLCDRGTLDGLAYWPDEPLEALHELWTTREGELARYAAVIHLRTPLVSDEFNHRNPLRTETLEEARAIDARIEAVWSGHPRRTFVESSHHFLDKVRQALDLVRAEVPACCSPERAL